MLATFGTFHVSGNVQYELDVKLALNVCKRCLSSYASDILPEADTQLVGHRAAKASISLPAACRQAAFLHPLQLPMMLWSAAQRLP
ncbi:MAG TPA: hypothetical protein VEP67_10975 [Thiobacillaceae bacterium]|nr:hypothetical protein [Thiobacillaceae bacterium]